MYHLCIRFKGSNDIGFGFPSTYRHAGHACSKIKLETSTLIIKPVFHIKPFMKTVATRGRQQSAAGRYSVVTPDTTCCQPNGDICAWVWSCNWLSPCCFQSSAASWYASRLLHRCSLELCQSAGFSSERPHKPTAHNTEEGWHSGTLQKNILSSLTLCFPAVFRLKSAWACCVCFH